MPRFPYPPDVNTDLRALFRLDRQNRTARDLGASSITRGEGSLDLYDTDAGPVTHRYGDLPDGSFGVGITHRGAFANVSDLIGGVQDKNTAQDGRLGAAEGRLDGHDGRLDGHASRLGTAEGRLDSHAGRIGSAEGRLDTHAGRIGATETKNSQQDTRLDSHAGRIGAVEGSAGSLGTRISNAEDRLDTHAGRIGATENVNSTQNGRLDSHVSRIGALENRMSALEDDTAHKMAQIDYWLRIAQNAPGLPPWGGW